MCPIYLPWWEFGKEITENLIQSLINICKMFSKIKLQVIVSSFTGKAAYFTTAILMFL
jgi:hypothetical protein